MERQASGLPTAPALPITAMADKRNTWFELALDQGPDEKAALEITAQADCVAPWPIRLNFPKRLTASQAVVIVGKDPRSSEWLAGCLRDNCTNVTRDHGIGFGLKGGDPDWPTLQAVQGYTIESASGLGCVRLLGDPRGGTGCIEWRYYDPRP